MSHVDKNILLHSIQKLALHFYFQRNENSCMYTIYLHRTKVLNAVSEEHESFYVCLDLDIYVCPFISIVYSVF
jgi:hypothetical protein